jgi:DNA-binding winged helix-turn-helix (wHTH) protein
MHDSQKLPTLRPIAAQPAHRRAISFGSFRLMPAQRLLLRGNEPLCLGSRALDILIALVERPGELTRKDELLARVWPDTFVAEENLKVQVAALRRVLGDGRGGNRYLVTIRGRGYCFVAPLTHESGASDPTIDLAGAPAPSDSQSELTT